MEHDRPYMVCIMMEALRQKTDHLGNPTLADVLDNPNVLQMFFAIVYKKL